MVPELKPCPFCGCEKILDGYIRDGREIVCGECRASIAAFHPDASKHAAERWNRRAEAALSAAEPARWLIEEHLPTGSIRWQTVEHEHHAREIAGKSKRTTVAPLYRDPPAPSVAVKALADAYKAGFDASSQGYNGEVFPEYEADNEWLAQRDSDLSALSAQVQDVAGWHDISTAPQDGTTFLAIMAKAYSPRATLCKVEDGKFFSPSQGEKFVVPGWNQWWPTHWMPLPAAPAKQEG